MFESPMLRCNKYRHPLMAERCTLEADHDGAHVFPGDRKALSRKKLATVDEFLADVLGADASPSA